MQLSIDYCITCNYRPMAASLAFSIKRVTGIEAVLNGSKTSGAFEVRIDQSLIFSKLQTNQFPDHALIVEMVKSSLKEK
ncbi:MAG: SelT/SelW/SelH family protein [bacterium]|nr:SelT/SelW/SelH family protein [bacterium]